MKYLLTAIVAWLTALGKLFATYVLADQRGVVILSGQDTGNIEASQRVVDMSEAILLLEPEEAPFTVLLRKLMKKEAVNPKFEWLEDEVVPYVDQINNAAGYVAGALEFLVDNYTYFAVGDIIKVFRTGETMLVTDVGNPVNTIDVTRSWGATAAAALVDNDFLYIMGQAAKEGATKPASRMTKKVNKFNYCEIFRTPVKLTATLEASKLYGVNSERAYQRRKKGVEHNRSLERAFWFGEKNEDLTAEPRRSTGGVTEFLTTNVTQLANEAAFTQSEFDKFLETLFLVGSDERWVFSSPLMLRLITAFAQSKLQIYQLELGRAAGRTFGIAISRYQSPHGVVNLVNTRIFKDYRTSGDIAGKVLIALDFDEEGAAYRYLRTRDTKLKTDIQANDADAHEDEYISECGLQLGQEKRHGILRING